MILSLLQPVRVRPLLGGLLLGLAFTSQAASWSVRSEGAAGYWITNGQTSINMPDEKTANKTAAKLNKAERKAKKRAAKDDSGFKAEESGPCSEASPRINC
jgi:hypothetical protein